MQSKNDIARQQVDEHIKAHYIMKNGIKKVMVEWHHKDGSKSYTSTYTTEPLSEHFKEIPDRIRGIGIKDDHLLIASRFYASIKGFKLQCDDEIYEYCK